MVVLVSSWTIPGVMNNKISFFLVILIFTFYAIVYSFQILAMSLFQELDNNPHLCCFDKYILQLVWCSKCWLKIWDKVHLLFYDQSTFLTFQFLDSNPSTKFPTSFHVLSQLWTIFFYMNPHPHIHSHFRKKIKLSGKWLFPINTSAYLTSQLWALLFFFFVFFQPQVQLANKTRLDLHCINHIPHIPGTQL